MESSLARQAKGLSLADTITEGMSIEEFQNQPLNRRPQCYCHGHRDEEGFIADERTDCGAEWAYVFEIIAAHHHEPEQNLLHVLYPEKNQSGEYAWKEAGRIDLISADNIPWTSIECGEKFERCSHYAWFHELAPRECNLSTQTFLGNRLLDPIHDPIAYCIDGKTYKATGQGGNASYLNRTGKTFPTDTWVASCIAQNNHRVELAIARLINGEYKLFDNVTAVYPPTLKAV
jgi:hypothetical protein